MSSGTCPRRLTVKSPARYGSFRRSSRREAGPCRGVGALLRRFAGFVAPAQKCKRPQIRIDLPDSTTIRICGYPHNQPNRLNGEPTLRSRRLVECDETSRCWRGLIPRTSIRSVSTSLHHPPWSREGAHRAPYISKTSDRASVALLLARLQLCLDNIGDREILSVA